MKTRIFNNTQRDIELETALMALGVDQSDITYIGGLMMVSDAGLNKLGPLAHHPMIRSFRALMAEELEYFNNPELTGVNSN